MKSVNDIDNQFGLSQKSIDSICGVFKLYPEIEEVIIYGSRSKGNYSTGSDIDFALKGKNVNRDTVSKIKNILEEELPLPYFFDITDFNSIKNPDLIEHINRVGKIFFKK